MTTGPVHFVRSFVSIAMVGALLLLAGCGGTGTGTNVTPTPTTQPTATTAPSTSTPAPNTATPAPNTPTPVAPTKTPAPAVGNLVINSPAMRSTISSPVAVTGHAMNIPGGHFTIDVRDSAGNVWGELTVNAGTVPNAWNAWNVSVPYSYSGPSVAGAIVVYDTNSSGVVTVMASIPVTLQATTPAVGNLVITGPALRSTISSPVHVTGRARNIFEGQFVVNVKDNAGNVLGQVNVHVTGNTSAWQTWAADVPFLYSDTYVAGVISAFDYSAKDGSVIDLVSIPVTIQIPSTGEMVINSPAMRSTISSPVHVTGHARNVPDGTFVVKVQDSAGTVYGQSTVNAGSGATGSTWQAWATDVTYAYSGAATSGSIVVYDTDSAGATVRVASIPVTLAASQVTGNIVLTSPIKNATISSPVHVTGLARNIFEGQFVVNVKDSAGKVLGQVNAYVTGGASAWQTWAADVPYTYNGINTLGSVTAFDYSAKDGSVIDLVSVLVTVRGTTQTGEMVINSPAMHATINSPVHVTGHARNVPDGTFVVKVQDSAGTVYGQSTVNAGSGAMGSTWQAWATDVTFAYSGAATSGSIVVYDTNSAGATVRVASIPVTLAGS